SRGGADRLPGRTGPGGSVRSGRVGAVRAGRCGPGGSVRAGRCGAGAAMAEQGRGEHEEGRRPTSPARLAALGTAEQAYGGRRPAAAQAVRAAGVEPELAAQALTQVELRRRAVAKFGAEADRLLFTRAGLEQATRTVVARRRAERLAAAGATRVADLG